MANWKKRKPQSSSSHSEEAASLWEERGGGVITGVKLQMRAGSERLNVHLDGEFAFSLAAELALGLHEGQALDAGTIRELLDRDQSERAYQSALHFLAPRPRSRAEVSRRLRERGYPPPAIDGAIARLEHYRFVDDQQFAEYWVGQRQSFHPRGPRALRAELRQKGVDTQTVDAAVQPAAEAQDESAYRAALKKARSLQLLDEREFNRQLYAFLARRGFEFDAIRTSVRRLRAEVTGEAGDPELDVED
jgi:regulatory protein